jgi:hypothetical protein
MSDLFRNPWAEDDGMRHATAASLSLETQEVDSASMPASSEPFPRTQASDEDYVHVPKAESLSGFPPKANDVVRQGRDVVAGFVSGLRKGTSLPGSSALQTGTQLVASGAGNLFNAGKTGMGFAVSRSSELTDRLRSLKPMGSHVPVEIPRPSKVSEPAADATSSIDYHPAGEIPNIAAASPKSTSNLVGKTPHNMTASLEAEPVAVQAPPEAEPVAVQALPETTEEYAHLPKAKSLPEGDDLAQQDAGVVTGFVSGLRQGASLAGSSALQTGVKTKRLVASGAENLFSAGKTGMGFAVSGSSYLTDRFRSLNLMSSPVPVEISPVPGPSKDSEPAQEAASSTESRGIDYPVPSTATAASPKSTSNLVAVQTLPETTEEYVYLPKVKSLPEEDDLAQQGADVVSGLVSSLKRTGDSVVKTTVKTTTLAARSAASLGKSVIPSSEIASTSHARNLAAHTTDTAIWLLRTGGTVALDTAALFRTVTRRRGSASGGIGDYPAAEVLPPSPKPSGAERPHLFPKMSAAGAANHFGTIATDGVIHRFPNMPPATNAADAEDAEELSVADVSSRLGTHALAPETTRVRVQPSPEARSVEWAPKPSADPSSPASASQTYPIFVNTDILERSPSPEIPAAPNAKEISGWEYNYSSGYFERSQSAARISLWHALEEFLKNANPDTIHSIGVDRNDNTFFVEGITISHTELDTIAEKQLKQRTDSPSENWTDSVANIQEINNLEEAVSYVDSIHANACRPSINVQSIRLSGRFLKRNYAEVIRPTQSLISISISNVFSPHWVTSPSALLLHFRLLPPI